MTSGPKLTATSESINVTTSTKVDDPVPVSADLCTSTYKAKQSKGVGRIASVLKLAVIHRRTDGSTDGHSDRGAINRKAVH